MTSPNHFIGSQVGKSGISVQVKNTKNGFEQAMRTFKRKVNQEGILKDLRKTECYETGTERRRRKAAEAQRRWAKTLRLRFEEHGY